MPKCLKFIFIINNHIIFYENIIELLNFYILASLETRIIGNGNQQKQKQSLKQYY